MSVKPTVTFIVPCYKLAHFLRECVESILSQSYRDLEVLIMDDCSPDNTPEVAASFGDSRVKHIRNDPNIGHLRNYNKGIGLARGKYIWLISADDYLRDPCILEKYVSLLDANPRVGYTCCAGVSVVNGKETEIVPYSRYSQTDCIVNGHVFLRKLLRSNFVLAASGLARRECYENISVFPLSREMAWTGDWYLWAIFALYYDVGYFTTPMVGYREHPLSMSAILQSQNSDILASGDIAVPWMIKAKADAAGLKNVARNCLEAIAYVYTKVITRPRFRVSRKGFEKSLCSYTTAKAERNWMRAQVYLGVGDRLYWKRKLAAAKAYYFASLKQRPLSANVWVKLVLLALGAFGSKVRWKILAAREGLPSDRSDKSDMKRSRSCAVEKNFEGKIVGRGKKSVVRLGG